MSESEGKRVVTAAELEQMTPQERHEHFLASIERDLTQVSPAFLAALATARRRTPVGAHVSCPRGP